MLLDHYAAIANGTRGIINTNAATGGQDNVRHTAAWKASLRLHRSCSGMVCDTEAVSLQMGRDDHPGQPKQYGAEWHA